MRIDVTTRADLLIRGVHLADFFPGARAQRPAAALLADAGRIVWVGSESDLPRGLAAATEFDGGGAWITPGFIDCHTHLVWAGNRAAEFEARLQGATYEMIARAGGGILATVRATRAAGEEELLRAATPRLRALAHDGATTVEIKSGYGLDAATEARMLRVARELGRRGDVAVRTTCLAAHAVPPEFAGRADQYVDWIADELLPALHRQGLADAVDAYCESIAFSPAQVRRVFAAAHRLGLPVRLHADQFSDSGGAALAAECAALSADHLEYCDEAGITAMAAAGTTAVVLPGAYYSLRQTQPPPVAALRRHGVPMAVASDCNPGTSPFASLRWAMNMACTLFGLTPQEALAGVTCHAARALGLSDRGTLAVGARADLAAWRIDHPRDLVCFQGDSPLAGRWLAGRAVGVPPPPADPCG
jgi:imidazolonepropionase